MSLTAVHPELGGYWNRVVKSAEVVYNTYLNDVSTTRVSLKPKDTLQRTEIEGRMENKIRTLLMTAVPNTVNRLCSCEQDVTCAQILYRTMIAAGPACREDRRWMNEILTQPKVIDLNKLHDHLITWKFASERLTKYGFQKPEATVLFDLSLIHISEPTRPY